MKYIVISKKISTDDYNKLEKFIKDYIKKLIKNKSITSYKDIEKQYITQKIGNDSVKRCRWDVFWGLFRSNKKFNEFIGKLYDTGINDDNLDAYLKSIVAKL
jgi:hypothetical protein